VWRLIVWGLVSGCICLGSQQIESEHPTAGAATNRSADGIR
jgi:hypothetical protein